MSERLTICYFTTTATKDSWRHFAWSLLSTVWSIFWSQLLQQRQRNDKAKVCKDLCIKLYVAIHCIVSSDVRLLFPSLSRCINMKIFCKRRAEIFGRRIDHTKSYLAICSLSCSNFSFSGKPSNKINYLHKSLESTPLFFQNSWKQRNS